MKIVRTTEEIREESPCALALGAFDGLHGGHLAVIDAALRAGRENGLESGVFTFAANPSGAPLVLPGEDREALLESLGLDRLYAVEFAAVKDMEAREFFREILLKRCRAKVLCCGEDFRFGKNAAGDAVLLKRLCAEAGAELFVVPPVKADGEKLSSTRIRKAVSQGDISLAAGLMGRPYTFALEVIHGNQLGRGLGTPTINQAMPEGFLLPPFGVYASWGTTPYGSFYGVTNIGVKPTVGSDRVLAETWMPEFSGDLYGRRVRLFLLEYLRPEQRFGSLEELKEQIVRDAKRAKSIAERTPPPNFPEKQGKTLYNPETL